MNENCGCCDGIEQLTPVVIANRPGLNALSYRVGTHGSFLETMLARLSNLPLEILLNEFGLDGKQKTETIYPLRGLTTRAQSDPAIAFLDAWATVADVLTFYQERIANEGYLRTATERRSILELARLVGYTLRPGVAASVFLAYTLEKDHNVTIPIGNRAQSVPGPGELPQSFETAEVLEARADWNALKPRLTKPQYITLTTTSRGLPPLSTRTVYLAGTATKLKPGDALLFRASDAPGEQTFSRVSTLDVDTMNKRSKITLQEGDAPLPGTFAMRSVAPEPDHPPSLFRSLIDPLSRPLIAQPPNSQRLERSVPRAFSIQSDIHPQLLINFSPILQSTLYSALANVQTVPPQSLQVTEIQALPVKAALFGHNLPSQEEDVTIFSPPISIMAAGTGTTDPEPLISSIELDAEYKNIVTGSWAVIETYETSKNEITRIFCKVTGVRTITRSGNPVVVDTFPGAPIFKTADAGKPVAVVTATDATAKIVIEKGSEPADVAVTTQTVEKGKPVIVTTTDESIPPPGATQTRSPGIKMRVTQVSLQLVSPQDLRSQVLPLATTTISIQGEKLEIAEEPLEAEIGLNTQEDNSIELSALYDGLKSGQRLILSGERTDVLQADDSKKAVPGVRASELIMLASVTQEVRQIQDSSGKTKPLPGDTKHTVLHLAKHLAYTYKRDTVTISANVVRATHGETRSEVLGSGDGSKALQRFTLKQSPLTYLAAATAAGAQSTLQVRVNNLLWHEAESLSALQPKDHSYILETDNSDKTSVIFGNGVHGARLPTGVENVKAVYRTGIGKPGNVKAGQISLLATKPLGVKSVVNPLRASGGADRDSADQARRNVPLAVMALDRLVSVQDYANFARTYAGIGKASAVQLRGGGRQLVNVTIAGAENIPIDTTSDLYVNLAQALQQSGDPHLPFRVDLAEILFLVISVKVRLLPDYKLEFVAPNIRKAMLDTFSFDRRELGQPVFQSEVLSVIQGIAGVDYVDLLVMGAVRQELVLKAFDDVQNKTKPDEAESAEEQQRETDEDEFLEELGLNTHADVIVNLAQVNPNPPAHPKPSDLFLPAQLAFLTPDIPDTLIITELLQ